MHFDIDQIFKPIDDEQITVAIRGETLSLRPLTNADIALVQQGQKDPSLLAGDKGTQFVASLFASPPTRFDVADLTPREALAVVGIAVKTFEARVPNYYRAVADAVAAATTPTTPASPAAGSPGSAPGPVSSSPSAAPSLA